MHLQTDKSLAGEAILEVGAGYTVKPGLDGVAAALDANLVPFARLVDFLPGLGEGGLIAAAQAGVEPTPREAPVTNAAFPEMCMPPG